MIIVKLGQKDNKKLWTNDPSTNNGGWLENPWGRPFNKHIREHEGNLSGNLRTYKTVEHNSGINKHRERELQGDSEEEFGLVLRDCRVVRNRPHVQVVFGVLHPVFQKEVEYVQTIKGFERKGQYSTQWYHHQYLLNHL